MKPQACNLNNNNNNKIKRKQIIWYISTIKQHGVLLNIQIMFVNRTHLLHAKACKI